MKKVHKPVHKALKLRHHKHTGKLLAHKHTSYRVLFLLMLAPIGLISLTNYMDVQADEVLTVTAKISATLPSDPPTIDSPSNNATTLANQIVVSGTCPVFDPEIIVVIYNNGSVAGSEQCTPEGNYSLPIALTVGANTLVATVINITNDIGASSPALTVTRNQQPPTTVPPVTKGDDNKTPPFLKVEEAELLTPVIRIIPEKAFVSIEADGKVTWTGKVEGGKTPYKMQADWGDGTVDRRTVHNQSLQTFTHTYKAPGVYTLLIKATDVNGVSTILHSAAVTPAAWRGKPNDRVKYDDVHPVVAYVEKNALPIWIAVLFALVFLWYLEHGRHHVRRIVRGKGPRIAHRH